MENCLHLTQARYFAEAKHVVRGWGVTWTVLPNIALSLTRLLWQGERTLREVHEKCLAAPWLVAKRIGLKNKTC